MQSKMLMHQSTPTVAKNNCKLVFNTQPSTSRPVLRGFCSLVRREPSLSRGDGGAVPGTRGSSAGHERLDEGASSTSQR